MDRDEYKVIEEFECRGKEMVTVRIGSNAHVMEHDEWRKIYGRNHQNRWKTKVNWNSFNAESRIYKTREVC